MAESMPEEFESDFDQTDGIMNLQILDQPVVKHYKFDLEGTVEKEIKNAVKKHSQVPICATQKLVMVLCCKDGAAKKIFENHCPLLDYTYHFGEDDLIKIMPHSEVPILQDSHVGGFTLKNQ